MNAPGLLSTTLNLQPGMGNRRFCQSFTRSSLGLRRLVRSPAAADWDCVSSLYLVNTYENSRSFFAGDESSFLIYYLHTHQILKSLVIVGYSHSFSANDKPESTSTKPLSGNPFSDHEPPSSGRFRVYCKSNLMAFEVTCAR